MSQRKIIRPDHYLFRFERSMVPGAELKLVEQMCWEIGFPEKNLPLYVTGQQPDMVENYPEML